MPAVGAVHSLPFRGGAAAAAEGVVIYRLLYRAALSVRKSFRAVRIAERNSYIENTPLGTPSGTAGEWKRLFFWLQKSGVNCEKRKRFTLSPIQPLSLFAPSEQKSSSPCTGEPRNAPQTLGGNPVQGSREAQRKRFTLSPIQPLSHGVSILNRRASSPCTGEPRFVLRRSGANPARGSREQRRSRPRKNKKTSRRKAAAKRKFSF